MAALVPLAMRTQVKRDARIDIQKKMDFADRDRGEPGRGE